MSYLYDLVLKSKKFVEYDKFQTAFLEDYLNLEKELLSNLNEKDKALFKDFKITYLNHLESCFMETCDYFLHYGLKIGLEASEKFIDFID